MRTFVSLIITAVACATAVPVLAEEIKPGQGLKIRSEAFKIGTQLIYINPIIPVHAEFRIRGPLAEHQRVAFRSGLEKLMPLRSVSMAGGPNGSTVFLVQSRQR